MRGPGKEVPISGRPTVIDCQLPVSVICLPFSHYFILLLLLFLLFHCVPLDYAPPWAVRAPFGFKPYANTDKNKEKKIDTITD